MHTLPDPSFLSDNGVEHPNSLILNRDVTLIASQLCSWFVVPIGLQY